MAHPYSTQTRLEALLGTALVAALLDRDHDGSADAGVYAGALERACNQVDARVRGLYVVPFAAITASPACDGMISDAADYATAALLFSQESPNSADAKYWTGEFDAQIEKIRSGVYQLDATLAPKQDADKGTTALSFTSGDTFIAGVNSDGTSKTNSW